LAIIVFIAIVVLIYVVRRLAICFGCFVGVCLLLMSFEFGLGGSELTFLYPIGMVSFVVLSIEA